MHYLLLLAVTVLYVLPSALLFCIFCTLGRMFHVLWTLSNRLDHALAGSTVPPLFAPLSPQPRRPLRVGEGGAALSGVRS